MRTPHFKGLYYFYMAARLQSLKAAAQALSVTQAAVSQQIRLLEEQLEVTLFHRQHRKVVLTQEGERLLPWLTRGFEAIEEGVNEVFDDDDPTTITLSVLPSMASRWLIPRLPRFYQEHPGLSVNLTMTEALETFTSGSVDVVIRFGGGHYEGLETVPLMPDYIYPVCHPSYRQQQNIQEIEDLKRVRLLDDSDGIADDLGGIVVWKRWLEDVGLDANAFGPIQSYNGSHYVIDAVLSGNGVAMVRHSLAAELVWQGHLVRLFDHITPLSYGYYLCAPPRHFRRPKVKQFKAWLDKEVAQFTQNLSP